MVRSRGKVDWAVARARLEFDLGKYVFRGGALQRRSAGKGRNSSVARSQASALRRQFCIRGASPDDDPMRIVALLRRKDQVIEGRSGLQLNRVATRGL